MKVKSVLDIISHLMGEKSLSKKEMKIVLGKFKNYKKE